MKKSGLTLVLIVAIAMIAFTGCKKNKFPGFEQTETGLYYKFHVQNEGAAKPADGDVLTVNMVYKVRKNEKDSILFDTKVFEQQYGQAWRFPLREPQFQGDIYEGLAMLGIGDSASFIVSADSVLKYSPQSQGIDSGTMIFFDIKLIAIQPKAEFEMEQNKMMEEHKIMMDSLKNREEADLAKYLADNKIKIKPAESGLYFIEIKRGAGAKPIAGQMVTVHYKGTMLDGTVFDSSEGRDPIQFSVGQGQVIPGWDEGILKMNTGGKAKFIIPSGLAYGENGAGPIPPYSPLVFEVELLNVK